MVGAPLSGMKRSMFRDMSWTTASAPAGREAALWRSTVCEAIFELDVTIGRADRFQASLCQQRVGSLGLSRITMNADQAIERTRQAIARSCQAQYEFVLVESGHIRVEQRDRDVVLKPGDSLLIYNGETFRLRTEPHSSTASFHIPASWLELWLPEPQKVAAEVIDGSSPWGRVLSALVCARPSGATGKSARDTLFADQFGGALAFALQAGSDQERTGAKGTFERCLQHLRTNANDCELDAQGVAEALKISLRYLHKLFAAHGTTYGAELLSIRLDLAARLLRQPQFNALPVAEIAWRAGFSDPSHFYRRFRECFGMPPGAYRSNPVELINGTSGQTRFMLS